MYYFPQLTTGTLVQYPFSVQRVTRTVLNETADGTLSTLADTNAERIEWVLEYSGLSDDEAAALEDLFAAAGGRRGTFVFLDPSGNLLDWSEDLGESVWTCDPLASVTAGEDAAWLNAASFQLSNTGQTDQGISQLLSAPGDLHYAFSLYARAGTPTAVAVERQTTAGAETLSAGVSDTWKRICSAGRINGTSEEIRFSLRIPPGTTVELCGLQVEAQPTTSVYKTTYSQGGVYGNARFADDTLRIKTHGPGNHSARIRITSGVRRS